MRLPWKRPLTEKPAPPSPASREESLPEETSPFAMARMTTVIKDNGYTCAFDPKTGHIMASWNDLPFQFRLSGAENWLGIATRWNPPEELLILDESQIMMALQEAANEWNRLYLQPTGYPVKTDEGWKVVFHQSIFVDAGVTDKQLTAALLRALDVHLHARDTILSLLPPVY